MVVYVNIGGNFIIKSDGIIGVFDIDKTTVYKTNRNYLSKVEKRGKIINVTKIDDQMGTKLLSLHLMGYYLTIKNCIYKANIDVFRPPI